MSVNLSMCATTHTRGPLVIDGDSPLLQGPLCNMVLRCSEYMRTSFRLMEDLEKKRPPFIYENYTNEEIDGTLQLADSLLHIPSKAEIDRTRWSKSHNVLELLQL
jgi:hypothetical protein